LDSVAQTLEKRIAELEDDVVKYKERADDMRLERIKEVMTPRVNWKVLDPFGEGEPPRGTSSKDMIKRMVRRLRRQDTEHIPSAQVSVPPRSVVPIIPIHNYLKIDVGSTSYQKSYCDSN
jgi:hypothetical protein